MERLDRGQACLEIGHPRLDVVDLEVVGVHGDDVQVVELEQHLLVLLDPGA